MSKFRTPFPWEPQAQPAEPSKPYEPPVALPSWGMRPSNGGEHANARHAIEDIARRHMEHVRSQAAFCRSEGTAPPVSPSDYTYEEALEAGRKAAYRHDDREN